MDNGSVNIQISKEIVNPIVEAKIKDAITEALGGKDVLIDKVVGTVLKQRVNKEGKTTGYSDDKYTWLEWAFGEEIEKQVKAQLRETIAENASIVKDALIKQIKSQKGANTLAAAMIAAMNKTLENTWNSSINIILGQKG